MNLRNKKILAAKTLGVGKNKIIFNTEGLSEIKEAITKQDIISLYQEGIIGIKPIKGRRKIVKRKTRRGPGKIKRTINKRKQNYVKITRKLRKYIQELKNTEKIDNNTYRDIRKKIRMSIFRSKAHLKEYIENPIKSRDEKYNEEKRLKDNKNLEITSEKNKKTKTIGVKKQ
jgi:large subunit ribosomal protein L19e